jgi:hypothetical protein
MKRDVEDTLEQLIRGGGGGSLQVRKPDAVEPPS